MAVALLGKRPTIIVSTMAILIHPSSARTSGMASRRVGRNSARSVWRAVIGGNERKEGKRAEEKEQTKDGSGRVLIWNQSSYWFYQSAQRYQFPSMCLKTGCRGFGV